MTTRSAGGWRCVLGAVSVGGGTLGAAVIARRYRREMRAAHARLATVDRRTLATEMGDVVYVECGSGEPLLVSHGIFQNGTSALLLGDLFPDRRLIAPCRFGYLGSTIPLGATPAQQADAYVAVLDALDIAAIDVVGISAGATAALRLALRHPDRVRHLVLLSGNVPGARTAVVQPSWARPLNRQLPLWLLKTLAPATFAYLAGVPKELLRSRHESLAVEEQLDGLFPVTPNVPGVDFDTFVSNADVNTCALEAITVPTLLVHAEDDPLVRYDAAVRAAARIPGAELLTLVSGGHFLLGQTDTVRRRVAAFFAPVVGSTSKVLGSNAPRA